MPEQSDDLALEGVEIERLADALNGRTSTGPRPLRRAGNRVARTRWRAPLAALNTAFATDGIVIRATGKAAKPISLIYLHRTRPRTRSCTMWCGWSRARGHVLENGPAAARFNKCMEIDVADGARLPPCARAGPRP
jgi:Fe-S cluster assembly protein SufD